MEQDSSVPGAVCDRRAPIRPRLAGIEGGTDSRLEVLGRAQLFAGLEAATLSWIAERTEQLSVDSGELIVRQGDAADGLYVIAAGLFGIWVSDADGADAVQVRDLGPGEVFGEMALLTRGTRSASVRCKTAGRLLYLDQHPFRELLHRDPEIASRIAVTLSRWLRAQDHALLEAPHQPAPPTPEPTASEGLSIRQIEVLRLLAEGKSNPEIAETLVLSRFTVNRHISNIFDKIGAANRVEATTYAYRHGFA